MQDSSLISDVVLTFESFVVDTELPGKQRPVNDWAALEEFNTQFAQLRYVSDWLHLWLLTGDAAESTCGDFTIYLQAIALLFADPSDVFLDREIEALVPPVDASDELQLSVKSASYNIPSALSPMMYRYCAQSLPLDRRAMLAGQFLRAPGLYRTQFI